MAGPGRTLQSKYTGPPSRPRALPPIHSGGRGWRRWRETSRGSEWPRSPHCPLLPTRPRPHAPHRLRSSVSSRSLAWLADSKFCKNARASFQAAWPRPMKLLRVGYTGQRGQTAHGRGPRTARTFSPPLELGKASPPPPRPGSAHDRQSLGATIGGAAGDTGPGVPLNGAAFPPRRHSLRLRGLGPTHPSSYAVRGFLAMLVGQQQHCGLRAPILLATGENRGSFQRRSPPSTEDPSPVPEGRCEDRTRDVCGTLSAHRGCSMNTVLRPDPQTGGDITASDHFQGVDFRLTPN